jgi:signal transduction histidine kinase
MLRMNSRHHSLSLRTNIETLLRSDSLDESGQQMVARLQEQTQRISSITSGLLLLARADAGKLVLEQGTVDLREGHRRLR